MDIGPTEADRKHFMEMRRRVIDTNAGLPMEKAPGMRKSKSKSKSRSKSKSKSKKKTKSKSKSRSKSKSKKKTKSKSKSRSRSLTKKEVMKDMLKQAVKGLPFLRNRNKRIEYIDKLKLIPLSDLKKMKNPIDVLQYVSTPIQARGLLASDLGETLIRQRRRYEPEKEIYQGKM